ncbi:NUDIX domain-containing protein [Corynebacterium felinum]|uniref:8-oxo-dGTP pyrophosphatase MutT (NUDIX family) n=1 Tax=Corynebacterium felinum TaxID=131318 RepID=A0ABU2BC83_9CORY|nr:MULTISPECIES: NUDIX domain-containing protein [Corynebacterium]MDF5821008.1 NUDIX domain-containing protein [Corynebacterium felinum]MDO4760879.1 NUDIX domain-containing protein [Corynebacterium sp.]MDR7356213.1 8-oxo-dGTP pyrophosphatase MutT (NUDIX family) [Corynebacterium felinum]WJY95545.1 dihydroneopterin triphosphate pyrophosphatase [Corynebacterium felinum]
MATPEFIVELREKIGHAPLWLPGATAVIIKDVPPGAPLTAVPEVLLIKRADNGEWTPVTGICDPGEEPHVTAVREAKEEIGVDIHVEALLGVGAVGPVEYANGDVVSYMDTAMRCSVIGDASPESFVLDRDEVEEAGWFSVMQMPPMRPRFRLIVGDAVAQLRRPEGFRPRMGYVKRERTR